MTWFHRSSPEVSVILSTRDRWSLAGQALGGVLRQEGVDLEVVLVDDGSTDPMPETLAELDDPRVHVVRLGRPEGAACARNVAFAEARGQWIAFLDDGDLWSPRKLATQLNAARRAAACFVYSAAVVLDESRCVSQFCAAPAPAGILRQLLARDVMPGGCSSVLARASLVKRVGGFDEAFSVLADWDLCIRLAQMGGAAACPEVLLARLPQAGNAGPEAQLAALRDFRQLQRKHRVAARALGARLDRRHHYRRVARRHRRAGRRLHAARTYLKLALEDWSPGDLGRALGILLGEPVFRLGARMKRRAAPAFARPVIAPTWLSLYG